MNNELGSRLKLEKSPRVLYGHVGMIYRLRKIYLKVCCIYTARNLGDPRP